MVDPSANHSHYIHQTSTYFKNIDLQVRVQVEIEVQVQVQVLPYVLSNMIVSSLSPFAPSLISKGENL